MIVKEGGEREKLCYRRENQKEGMSVGYPINFSNIF
jgi:hypothetical protein